MADDQALSLGSLTGRSWIFAKLNLKMSAPLMHPYRFNDRERSITIQRHDLPSPWINYLSNGNFHAFVSQAGGGFAWWKSPAAFRITRYRHYNLPIDSPGFYVYITENGRESWSPTQRPCHAKPDRWSAVHSPGKTVFHAEKDRLAASLKLFVTPDDDVLVWNLKIKNLSGEPRTLDVVAYSELSQLGWKSETMFGYYIKHMLKVWHDRQTDALIYLDHHDGNPRLDDVPLVFFAASRKVASFAGDRNAFMGPYRDERLPLGVERGHCGNSTLHTGEPCAALQNQVTVKPGEELELHFFLGVIPAALKNFQQAKVKLAETLRRLKRKGEVTRQESRLDHWWKEHFSACQCRIPDRSAKRQINTWNVINSVHTGRYSRSVNAAAPGVRGVGFRDSCQDMLAIAYRKPGWATERFLHLLSQQYPDGHVVHSTYPEEREAPAISVHSDDHLWLPLIGHALVAETGDASLLNRKVPFLSGKDHVSACGSGTVWEHLLGCVKFTESHLGSHAIPLTLKSDWNDIIGKFAKKGRGESVFAGQQYLFALNLLAEMAAGSGRDADREWLDDCSRRQRDALLACAWDGKWWRRGFDDDGAPLGSAASPFGNIFLNPQSWAVLSGLGTLEQQKRGMMAARTLDTGIGIKLLDPGFKTWPDVKDPFSGYGPGTGENGAIFCHANTWAIIAEALLGNAGRAWGYFTQLIPHNIIQKIGVDRYQAEPYAWVSNIVGPENPRFGWANVEQISGTAPWMDVAATQYLLGIRPRIGGLLIDPCLPAGWDKAQVTRQYRGCRLDIRLRNPHGVAKGIVSLTLDHTPLDLTAGPIVPPAILREKAHATILAVMG